MSANKTFYEILGVARNAKLTEIGLAYQRLRAEMQKETSAPNPRLAAMAKVAYETLSDPARRAEYDATLGSATAAPLRTASKRGATAIVASITVLVAAGGAGYYFFAHRAARSGGHPGEAALSPQDVQQAVAPKLGRVQGALMSGEVRDLGVAVVVGEDEMATTCRGMVPGMTLSVKWGDSTSDAELVRTNTELDICALKVKGAGAGVRIRPGVPGPQEKVDAVFVDPAGKPQVRPASVTRVLKEPQGPAFELKAGAPLPNGATVFDSQARLVGIVVTPHDAPQGAAFALGAARIAQARGASEEPAVAHATAPPAAPANEDIQPAAASQPAGGGADAPASAAPGRAPRGSIVDAGFTTLWKEDERGALVEVLDHPDTGTLGDPIAYWTLWEGRDVASNPQTHCLVTYGEDDEVVADYDQIPGIKSPKGYWYCALTRFQVDLADLPVGDYRFTIFVDGEQVAQGTTRIEKKFWNRGKYAFIVLVLGLMLLFYVRKKRGR